MTAMMPLSSEVKSNVIKSTDKLSYEEKNSTSATHF